MNTMLGVAFAGLLFAGAAASASAATVTWAGSLGDAGNVALVGSDLGAPDFTSDFAIANNVALYGFDVLQTGTVTLVGSGTNAGGIDPVLSLFSGTGHGAAFVGSNYGLPTENDFTYSGILDAGHYQVAVSVFGNMSFAENYGGGTLGDGFTMLAGPYSLGDGSYHFTLTTPVPEPAPLALLAAGGAMFAWRACREKARAPA